MCILFISHHGKWFFFFNPLQARRKSTACVSWIWCRIQLSEPLGEHSKFSVPSRWSKSCQLLSGNTDKWENSLISTWYKIISSTLSISIYAAVAGSCIYFVWCAEYQIWKIYVVFTHHKTQWGVLSQLYGTNHLLTTFSQDLMILETLPFFKKIIF